MPAIVPAARLRDGETGRSGLLQRFHPCVPPFAVRGTVPNVRFVKTGSRDPVHTMSPTRAAIVTSRHEN